MSFTHYHDVVNQIKREANHSSTNGGHKQVKNADLKIWSFLAKKHGKTRFLNKIQIFFLKLPIESVYPNMSPKTFFWPPKGPGTKKLPSKDEVRVRVQTENSFSGRYLHLKVIPKGVYDSPRSLGT